MNIRIVRKKIKSVTNVKKITKAMEMISVIKMKKAQTAALEAKPYQQNIEEIIRKLTANIDPHFSRLLNVNAKAIKKELAIVISTNKGLCGSFNFNLYRYLSKNVQFEGNDFIVVGKKGALFVNKMGGHIIADFTDTVYTNSVSAIFEMALNGFLKGQYTEVNIYFNKFVSTLKNEPIKLNLLPIVYHSTEIKEIPKEYLVEPDPKELIDHLLQSYVEEKIRNCMIESEAGEHSSRMIAMKNASDSSQDVIYNLTLLRNKIRQEKITNELLDMMSAQESVSL